jgi:non-specific serine/threonine protein kinase
MRTSASSSAGPLLDPQAKAEYRERLRELEAELQEAEEFNDPGRAEQARTEIEFLAQQLEAAVGLGGRDREAASDSERARVAVTLRIKEALKKIERSHPALGQHLNESIKTGRFCSYTPGSATPPSWRF